MDHMNGMMAGSTNRLYTWAWHSTDYRLIAFAHDKATIITYCGHELNLRQKIAAL